MNSPALNGTSLHSTHNSSSVSAGSLEPAVNPEVGVGKRPQWARGAVLLAALAALWLVDQTVFHLGDQLREWSHELQPAAGLWTLLGGRLAYAVLLSLPFVPGMELGLILMVVFGVPGIAMAYGGTILGLCMAFALGRRLRSVPGGITVDAGTTSAAPLSGLVLGAGRDGGRLRRIARVLLRHPALLLAALLNMPGNTLLGGGGGIAMLFGAARVLAWPAFLLTVAIATAPLPLLFLMGWTMP